MGINEDIRFYLPSDPYYYEVDNLPLKQLLGNDRDLQAQIDAITNPDPGEEDAVETFGRGRFDDLRPYSIQADPGKIWVKPGNFIARNNRATGKNSNSGNKNAYTGLEEKATNKEWQDHGTKFVESHNWDVMSRTVGRTSVHRYSGKIGFEMPAFDSSEFGTAGGRTAPLGRLDLVCLTAGRDGSMDDGMTENPGGQVDLCIVKGAGIIVDDESTWNRKETMSLFKTIGTAQEDIPIKGHGLILGTNTDLVDNPEFGTVPAPDDVVNSFYRALNKDEFPADQQLNQALNEEGIFSLPICYVYIPAGYQTGQHIPKEHIIDIRPFFRTTELTLRERQACMFAAAPGAQNTFVTESHLDEVMVTEINRDPLKADVQSQINDMAGTVGGLNFDHDWTVGQGASWHQKNNYTKYSGWVQLMPGRYMAYHSHHASFWGNSNCDQWIEMHRAITMTPGEHPEHVDNNSGQFPRLQRGIEPKLRTHGNGTATTSEALIRIAHDRNDDDDYGGCTSVIDFEVPDIAATIGGVAGGPVPVCLKHHLTGNPKSSTVWMNALYYCRIGEVS